MNKHLAVALLGLLAVAAPFAVLGGGGGDEGPEVDEKDVVVLTTSNFDGILKKSKFALVEFYAPWCGHCKTLKPHYAKAATELKAYDDKIVIGKVDATEQKALGEKYEVKGYPTLKWFVDGKLHSDYNGGRDAEGIVKWIKKKTGPATTEIKTAEALAEKETSSPVIVVGYFKALKGADYDTFKEVATKSEDALFLETTDAKVAKAAGIDAATGIALIKNFKGEEREVVKLTDKLTADSLKELITSEKLPLSLEFNSENSEKIFQSGIPKHVILWGKADEVKLGSDIINTFRTVAKEFKGKAVFVTANSEDSGAEPIGNYFGLKEAKTPTVVGFWMEKNKKFKFSGEYTEEEISKFAASVVDGTAEAEYKSAAVPENDQDEGVTVVVGKTFEKIVLDKSKDVLLEVYAPWCGHCKKLAPIYVKLAKRFEKIDSVVIAKFDGTENEHPEVEAKGYPTILFYPAGEGKKPITFEGGDRSLKAITKFIKQHATVPYELPKKGEEAAAAASTEGAAAAKDTKDEL